MDEKTELNGPWMVAVWPGMGNVAISAGFYLMAKLGVHHLAEFQFVDLFDVEYAEVKDGLVRTGQLPRSRLFAWLDPTGKHDIVIFVGEAQPPMGKYAFCRRLIDFVKDLGVERVFTFASMATEIRPEQPSRVFGVATDEEILAELRAMEVEILEEGNIGGLNGVLLGVAAENGMHGIGLLGEIPQLFSQIPYPKASLAVLEKFSEVTGLDIDFEELREQTEAVEERLSELYSVLERAFGGIQAESEDTFAPQQPIEDRLSPANEERIEKLFDQAKEDRSKAYELKRVLDHLGVFKIYEDRFLDLFKKPWKFRP